MESGVYGVDYDFLFQIFPSIGLPCPCSSHLYHCSWCGCSYDKRILCSFCVSSQVLRDVFNYRPKLTKEQFLSVGFAERKVLMTRDVLLFCQAKNSELTGHVNSNRVTAKRRSVTADALLSMLLTPRVLV